MLNIILRRVTGKGKPILTNPNPEHKLIFKRGALDYIKKVKGWKTDSQVAQALGVTRAYINMIRNEKASVSANVVTRLAFLLGSTGNNWWVHFEIVPRCNVGKNHPLWNMEKYNGRIPYDEYSPMAELRSRDYEVEKNDKRYSLQTVKQK
jgi:transcriptional regulator with XRE-family HTH domain